MTHWTKLAADGDALISQMPKTGSVKLKRVKAAEALGISAMTLHNYQAARTFAVSLKPHFPELASGLLSLPATAVGVYSRWWQRDPPAAQQHLRRALAEGWSAAKITTDERAAREKKAPLSMLNRALRSSNHERQLYEISAIVANGLGSENANFSLSEMTIERNTAGLSRALGVGEILVSRFIEDRFSISQANVAKDYTIAVLPVERGVTGDAHRKYAKWTLARATVCASAHKLSLVLLEDTKSVMEFIKALADLDAFIINLSEGAYLFELTPKSLTLVAPADRFAEVWSGVRP